MKWEDTNDTSTKEKNCKEETGINPPTSHSRKKSAICSPVEMIDY